MEMEPVEAISGIWSIPSDENPERDEFMHLGRDGRAVNFIYIQPDSDRMMPMKNWFQYNGNDEYLIRCKPDGEEWMVEMHVTEGGLRMVAPKRTHDFKRVAESEVPDWFRPKLDKALTEMTEEEKKAV